METDASGKQPEEQPARHGAEHLAEHRWKPGQSGNKSGRRKGSVNLTTRIQKKLLEAVEAGDSTYADALAKRIVQVMLKDPVKATRLILGFQERDEGAVVKEVDLSVGVNMRDVVAFVGDLSDAEVDELLDLPGEG